MECYTSLISWLTGSNTQFTIAPLTEEVLHNGIPLISTAPLFLLQWMTNPFDPSFTSNPFAASDWSAAPFGTPNPFGAPTVGVPSPFDAVRGLASLDENKLEDSETFSVSEVRYKAPSPIVGLVTNNNILVFGLENGHIIRLNLLEPAGLEGS